MVEIFTLVIAKLIFKGFDHADLIANSAIVLIMFKISIGNPSTHSKNHGKQTKLTKPWFYVYTKPDINLNFRKIMNLQLTPSHSHSL